MMEFSFKGARPGGEMVLHELKIWPVQFDAILAGLKRAEVRVDDRGFAVHDELLLQEWLPKSCCYTGRSLRVTVTHIDLVTHVDTVGATVSFAVISFTPNKEEA